MTAAEIEALVQRMELDLLEFTGDSLEGKLKRLPLTDKNSNISLIINLFNSKQYKKELNGLELRQVLEHIISRIES